MTVAIAPPINLMLSERRRVLEQGGASPDAVERVLPALGRPLPDDCPDPAALPPGSETFVPDWIACAVDAHQRGAVAALRDRVVELNFPIVAGLRHTPDYRRLCLEPDTAAADLPRGRTDGGPAWEAPDRIRLFLHDTGAGLLPVIEAPTRADFLILVRAFGYRNEPVPVPDSMGANFLNGYVNRWRFAAVRDARAAGLLNQEPLDSTLWKDRLLLLSAGAYSGVPAATMELTENEWLDRSRTIRLHHESCHVIVRRLFPTLVFGIQDELVADFAGLMEAAGTFRAHDFLAFMGLENFPTYRTGGRFENYLRRFDDHAEAIQVVQRLLVDAAHAVEAFFARWDSEDFRRDKIRVLAALTFLPLEVLAGPDAAARLSRLLPTTRRAPSDL